MLCKNCGHEIIEYGGYYFHVYAIKPSLLYIGLNCENEDSLGDFCNCVKPEPNLDDTIEQLNHALRNTNRLVEMWTNVMNKFNNKEGDK
ncbi:MAG: hypothetical protein QXU98_14040 [Candidatus Parvarchaeota archaeon]